MSGGTALLLLPGSLMVLALLIKLPELGRGSIPGAGPGPGGRLAPERGGPRNGRRPGPGSGAPGVTGGAAQRSARSSPACAAAARTVCSSRTAMVIGPTPPGTGVISEARAAADSKWTSPTLPSL